MFGFIENVLFEILRQGCIPDHATFIMDGNRRYAKKLGICPKLVYDFGFNNELKMIDIFYNLGVKELSVWMISVDNFERDLKKIAPILECIDKLCDFIQQAYLRKIKYGTGFYRSRFIGEKQYMQKYLSKSTMGKIEFINKSEVEMNSEMTLFIYVAYVNRSDIMSKIKIKKTAKEKQGQNERISKHIFGEINGSIRQPLDLMIRTSGAERLSDFMGWYIDKTVIIFEKCYWVEFNLKMLLKSFLLFKFSK